MVKSKVADKDLRRGQYAATDREDMSVVVGSALQEAEYGYGEGLGRGGCQEETVEGEGGDDHYTGEGGTMAQKDQGSGSCT